MKDLTVITLANGLDEKKPEILDKVKSLMDTNLQQRKQIQSLLHQLAEKKKNLPQNLPAVNQGQMIQQIAQRLDKVENQANQDARSDVFMRIMDRLDSLESKQHSHPAGPKAETKGNPSLSDLTQLLDSIHQLSLSVGSDSTQPKGMDLKPEYYVHVLAKGGNVNNMSLLTNKPEELMYGMIGLFDNLLATGGDAMGYFKRLNFVSRRLMERNFTVSVCAKYDKHVVEQVITGKTRFSDFNPVAAGLFLHGGATTVKSDQSCPQQQWGPKKLPARQTQLHNCNRENTPAYMPEWWPAEICFLFNARSC